jgi:phospholipid transport system transporter-binding protein
MSFASIEPAGNGRLRVSGVLDFGTVAALEARGRALLAAMPDAVIDLSGVERANSAGLVLLLEWLDQARAARRRLRYDGVPEALLEIAGVSNVAELLPVVAGGERTN